MPTGQEDNAQAIPVPTKGGEPEEKKQSDLDPYKQENIVENAMKKGGKEKVNPEELSEEDKALKEGLELAVTRLREDDTSLHKQALDHLVKEIRSATSSMTSVPKPLKFLRPHYDILKSVYESWSLSHSMKKMMADVMSVLAMTMAEQGSRESLKFKLQGNKVNISSWGHEYVRSLAGEISEEYNQRSLDAAADDDVEADDLMVLVDDIIPFQMRHNAEAEAVDLLIETRQLSKLADLPEVDERNYERVCLYLIRTAGFMADPDELVTLYDTAYAIYKAQKKYTDALRIALTMKRPELIAELFTITGEAEMGAGTAEEALSVSCVRKQMALLLGRHRSNFTMEEDEVLNDLIGNVNLSDRFLDVARDMDLTAPKTPDDIYKTHLSSASTITRRGANTANTTVDSARANLASTFVNAFVNAGFCKDKLLIEVDNGWLFKNKGHGMMSAAASLGMLMMWNVDEGLNQLDKFFHHSEDFVKAGACLGVGIVSSGVRNEADPALALLSDYIGNSSLNVRIASICGLGIAYAGAEREEVKDLLEGVISNTESSANITEVAMAALSLGLVFVGTCNEEISTAIMERLMESTETDLNQSTSRFLCLGLGLLYLNQGEKVDAVLEVVRTVTHPRGKYAEVTLQSCAYACSGDVLKVQELLRMCTDHLTDAAAAEHQAVAVLGIALTTCGEEIGSEMTLRTFEHLLHYGELPVKRVVPLAYALLYISNPEYTMVDQLSRLSHDQDPELAQCAILALGLVSAGTNNSRVAGLLRQLSDFYSREANHLFVVRIAQGLNSMGKGLLGIGPFHSDRLLLNSPGLGGILVVLHACIDIKGTILDKFHYLLFYLGVSMNPRYLVAVDAELNPVKASVRVGQAVETVGQAGRPKTITGFQTHTTPVLLGYKDRAELAGREYRGLASTVMENVVIVEKIPEEGTVAAAGAGSASSSSISASASATASSASS